MITIKEEKIAELMFDIWHKSNDLKNPVMVGEYIAEKLTKVKNLAIHDVSKSLKVDIQHFDLRDCPYQINTLLEKHKINSNDIISIARNDKYLTMTYKTF